MTTQLTPSPIQRFVDNNGVALTGGKVFTYAAGTTTKQTTYIDSTGSTPQTNPVILNSRGEPQSGGQSVGIWLTPGLNYKMVLAPSTDTDPPTSPIWTVDNIPATLTNAGVQFATVALAKAATIPSGTAGVQVLNYATAGDDGGGYYIPGSSGAGSGKFQSADGQWWILSDPYPNVRQFGATGNGSTDDTAAVQNAENFCYASGQSLRFPSGTYIISNTSITKKSGVSWFGAGQGISVIKAASATFSTAMVSAGTSSNMSFYNLSFDTSNMTPSGYPASLAISSWTDGEIAACDFVGIQYVGMLVSGGSNFTIRDNYFLKSSTLSTLNEAIWVRSTSSTPTNYQVFDNIIQNAGTDFTGSNFSITGNVINGFGYGAAITVEQGAIWCIIENNVCVGGTGIDSNGYTPAGIESWASFSTVVGNVCYSNAGAGIHAAGDGSIYSSNVCVNNGQYSGTGVTAAYRVGIISRYSSATYNGSTSVISGNVCLDTGGGTQLYGYRDDGSNVQSITLADNIFTGAIGPMNASGQRYDFKGPRLVASVSKTGFTITNGSFNSSYTASVTGAAVGDTVSVSINQTLSGVIAYGEVTSTNTVQLYFYNPSGGSVTVPNFTANVSVSKPINYAAY